MLRWSWSVAGICLLIVACGRGANGVPEPASTMGAANSNPPQPEGGDMVTDMQPPAVPPSVGAPLEDASSPSVDLDAGHGSGAAGVGGSGGHDAEGMGGSVGGDAGSMTAAGEYLLLTIDGLAVNVYLPAPRRDVAAPVVFSLHGLSIPSVMMADITGLPAVADAEGFIAVFPEGSGGTWNTGGASCGLGSFVSGGADDAAYLENILDAIEALRPIDRSRVFLSGFSMGGYGTNALGCTRNDVFRALAPAAGGMPLGPCSAGTIPVMLFHGTADATIGYDCGVQARDAWVAHNGCSAEVDTVNIMGGKCEWNVGCPENGQVVLCTFDGMGHGWAGSINPFAFGGLEYESATALMWQFFKNAP